MRSIHETQVNGSCAGLRTCDHPDCDCHATKPVKNLISILPTLGDDTIARAKELALQEFGFTWPRRAMACDQHFRGARRFAESYVLELGLA
jgi:hypothetical protein